MNRDCHILCLADSCTTLALYGRDRQAWELKWLREYRVALPLAPQTAEDIASFAEELAERIVADSQEVVTCHLVVPTSWCLVREVNISDGSAGEQAALFEFEEFVPVDLEKLTCATKRQDDSSVLVVAAHTDAMSRLLQKLEDSNIKVESITVDGLLLGEPDSENEPDHYIGRILSDDRHLTLTVSGTADTASCQFTSVHLAPTNCQSIRARQIETALMHFQNTGAWQISNMGDSNASSEIQRMIESHGMTSEAWSKEQTLNRIMERAIDFENPLDLRRGELSSTVRWRPVHQYGWRCGVLVLVLLSIMALRLVIQERSLARAIAEIRPAQQRIYREAFPEQDVPAAPALRLQSERIKLEGLTASRGNGVSDLTTLNLEAVDLLKDVVAVLPKGIKVNVSQLQIDPQSLRLTGRTNSHNGAGSIVQAVNQVPTLMAEPARTKLRKDGTVDFQITVTRSSHAQDR